jgi:hemoglobin
MIKITKFLSLCLFIPSLTLNALAQDDAPKKEDSKKVITIVNEKCPISSKAIDSTVTTEYEGKTYGFCCEKCLTKFKKERADSLYDKIGGDAAMTAAVDLFYVKVLADDRVNEYFEDVNMKRQKSKQKAFLAAALGSPTAWEGKDMRKAHADLDITESEFGAIAGHLQKTLEELKVKEDLIKEIMTLVGTTKDDVLNRKVEKKETLQEK